MAGAGEKIASAITNGRLGFLRSIHTIVATKQNTMLPGSGILATRMPVSAVSTTGSMLRKLDEYRLE
jgi:hypothetical protein